MTPLPLADRTITEVAAALRAGETSSRELTDACLARIERDAERLNTFLAVGPGRRPSAADEADAALARGEGDGSAAARNPVRAEGHLRHARARRRRPRLPGRPADHGRLADPGGLPVPVRLLRRGAPAARPAPCCWARRTATSSRWAQRTRTAPTARSTTRGTSRRCPVARRAARPRPSRVARPTSPSAPIPAARSASPRR